MHLHVFSISRAEFWFGALSARHQGPSSDLARLPRRRLGCSGRAFLHQVHRKRGRLSHFLWFWSSWYQFFDWINCAYWEILNFFVPLGLFAVTRSSGVRQWSQLHVFFLSYESATCSYSTTISTWWLPPGRTAMLPVYCSFFTGLSMYVLFQFVLVFACFRYQCHWHLSSVITHVEIFDCFRYGWLCVFRCLSTILKS